MERGQTKKGICVYIISRTRTPICLCCSLSEQLSCRIGCETSRASFFVWCTMQPFTVTASWNYFFTALFISTCVVSFNLALLYPATYRELAVQAEVNLRWFQLCHDVKCCCFDALDALPTFSTTRTNTRGAFRALYRSSGCFRLYSMPPPYRVPQVSVSCCISNQARRSSMTICLPKTGSIKLCIVILLA